MDIPPFQRHIDPSRLPLEKLAASTTVSEGEKSNEVARQFEAILLRNLLSHARQPLLAKPAGGSSVATSLYDDTINNTLAETISHSGALGLARTLAPHLKLHATHR